LYNRLHGHQRSGSGTKLIDIAIINWTKPENAEKTWLQGWAALYPMVTMNGENVITNGKLPTKKFTEMAIAFAIFNYHRFTGDYSYIPEKIEVLIDCASGIKEPTCPKTKSICYSWGYGTQ
jgi:hypothetical protein